jgi:hypothetical protein
VQARRLTRAAAADVTKAGEEAGGSDATGGLSHREAEGDSEEGAREGEGGSTGADVDRAALCQAWTKIVA